MFFVHEFLAGYGGQHRVGGHVGRSAVLNLKIRIACNHIVVGESIIISRRTFGNQVRSSGIRNKVNDY